MSAETQTPERLHQTSSGRQDSPQDEREREREEQESNDNDTHSSDSTVRGSLRTGEGGQSYYVAPSSYLKPLGRPQGAGAKVGAPGYGENGMGAEMERKQMSSLDRDQVEGLVSVPSIACLSEKERTREDVVDCG